MVFTNSWAYYQIHKPDKIPDLNPNSDKEAMGCLAGVCGFIVASIIFVLVTHLLFSSTVSECIKGYWFPLLMLINCIAIYPILIILLMQLSFKAVDKKYKKKKK